MTDLVKVLRENRPLLWSLAGTVAALLVVAFTLLLLVGLSNAQNAGVAAQNAVTSVVKQRAISAEADCSAFKEAVAADLAAIDLAIHLNHADNDPAALGYRNALRTQSDQEIATFCHTVEHIGS